MKMTQNGSIKILAIESSCDETAAAVVSDGRKILSNVINSQISLHTRYGGVVPELASRKHIENINYVVKEALESAGETLGSVDAIAVTNGPGLVGALLIGVSFAKALAFAADKPLVAVNHIEGHVCANFLEYPDLEPPFLCLIVSGGHTHLAVMKDYGVFEIIGKTRDDAAGEAFDKVARAIGLGYPGGPKIEKEAQKGNPKAIDFPRGKIDEAPLDFSFSGLKSAVLNYINHCKMSGIKISTCDIAASFQQAVTDVLVERAVEAALRLGEKRIVMAGGVASNGYIRNSLEKACSENGIALCVPRPALCTDNAAMIGSAAYYRFLKGERADLSLNAVPGLSL